MNRGLRIWHKLALMVAPLALLAGLLGAFVVRSDHARVIAAQREGQGAKLLQGAPALLRPLAAHASYAAMAVSGDATAVEPLRKVAGEMDQAIAALVAQQAEVATSAEVRRRTDMIGTMWKTLRDNVMTQSMIDSEARHRALGLAIAALSQQIADDSGLTQTESQDARRLTQVLVRFMPRQVLSLSTLRARASTITLRGGALADDVLLATSLVETYREAQRESDNELQAGFDASPRIRVALFGLANRVRQSVDTYSEMVLGLRSAVVRTTQSDHYRLANVTVDDQFALIAAANRALGEVIADNEKQATTRRAVVLGTTLGGLLIAVLAAWWVSGDIRRQIASVRSALGAVDEGRLDARAEVLTHDELGELAASLNTMFDNTLSLIQSREQKEEMQASIMKLLDEVSGVGEGDLTREAEVTADATGAIADSFNVMIAQLRQIIGDVQRTSMFVSESSVGIQGGAARLASASERQSSQIAEVTTAVAEMVASIRHVSDNAATSAIVADQARSTAAHGAQVVQRTRQGMDAIRQHVQETSKRIKRLGENAQEIGEIVQLIGDISDRTSILALNASIQAAAAGEAGRGFAVVAEEVEHLADRAADATKRIATLIRTTQTETAGTLAAMEDVTREVVSGSGLATEAAEALGEIERVSNQLAELIVAISAAAKHQANGSEVVGRSMQSVSAIAQQTAPAARSAAEAVAQLAERANALRLSVQRFRLPEMFDEAPEETAA